MPAPCLVAQVAMHKTPSAAADAVVQAAARQWAEHEDCRDDITILVAFLDNVPESVRLTPEDVAEPRRLSTARTAHAPRTDTMVLDVFALSRPRQHRCGQQALSNRFMHRHRGVASLAKLLLSKICATGGPLLVPPHSFLRRTQQNSSLSFQPGDQSILQNDIVCC